jgi:uncharacterized protein DUF5685
VFGIIRPCRHRLGARLGASWTAHLCGLCLALRADHGQLARVATNYDGLIVSVLTEAQATAGRPAARRTAGPCPLRGMRTASVARGEGARLAAAVSLVLASAKVRDHVADRDGLFARRPVAAAARRVAAGWDRGGARSGAELGFGVDVLLDAVHRQQEIEARTVYGAPLLAVTEPTETATGAAFAHTAVLAGRPAHQEPLAEAGRLFGRLAHLLDAVDDREEDARAGAWNPIAVTGTPLPEVRRLCDDAVHGVRLALRGVDFADGALAHALLVHELPRAADRSFGTTCAHVPSGSASPQPPSDAPPEPPHGRARSLIPGCAVWAGLCCTCQICCREHYPDPWSGKQRAGCCSDCDCSDCCDVCDPSNCCCDCCSNCDCGDGDCGCCDCDCDCGC